MDLRELSGTPSGPRHPWEVARANFFRDLLSARGPLGTTRTVLDVGAGDGYLAQVLAGVLPSSATVVCVDSHYDDSQLRSVRGETGASISFARDVPPGQFELVLLLDVIEHVADDRAFVHDHVGRVRPGGTVLVSVPAWQSLYGHHDRALGHFRRYRPAELRAVLSGAGLVVESAGGLFHSLLLPRAATVMRERLRRIHPARAVQDGDVEWKGIGAWSGGAAVTRCISAALAADTALSTALAGRAWSLPGLSAWAVARKR